VKEEFIHYHLRDQGMDEETFVKGYYFNTFNHDYLLVVDELQTGIHCVIKIFSIDCLQDGREIENMTLVKYSSINDMCHQYTIDVWSKYYFIRYEEKHEAGYQLYHSENEIDAQAAVLKAAVQFGIDKGKIQLY
jgi:hypothetical protein